MLSKDVLILFPMVLFFLLFFGATGSLIYFSRKRHLKKSQSLIRFFNGNFVGFFGAPELHFSKTLFRILRMASGAGRTGVGGTFPTLWAYTKPYPKVIIGNSKSGKYTQGRFLVLPPHLNSNIGSTQVLIGAESKEAVEKIKAQLAANLNLSHGLALIFKKDFCHLTVSQEFHVGGPFLIQKKYVFRYTCLPEQIYDDPKSLEDTMKVIIDIAQTIGLKFEEI